MQCQFFVHCNSQDALIFVTDFSFRFFYGTAKEKVHFPTASLPDAVESEVESCSNSNDEDYENSETESETESGTESETESESEADEEPQKKKAKVDPLFKWPKETIKWTMPETFDEEIHELSINERELPEDVEISRHSSAFDFYKLFVTDELIEAN